jgi:asparagine synthetase B (glutamine-hydrolysing)
MNNDTLCIYRHKNNPYDNYYTIDHGIRSSLPLTKHNNCNVIIIGEIYNINELKKRYNILSDKKEIIILELYFRIGHDIKNILKGIFVVVIIDESKIVIFRDYFSIHTIYYYINNEDIVITNRISEMKHFIKLEFNEKVLAKYLLSSTIFLGDTFFKDVITLKHGEIISISIDNAKAESIYPKDEERIYIGNIKERNIINNIDKIIKGNIKEITDIVSCSNVVNSLSGGVDSSYLQIVLKELGYSLAYTHSHAISDKSFIEPCLKYLEIDHKIIELNEEEVLEYLWDGIEATESPFMFEGEILENKMFSSISDDYNDKLLITSGNAADTVFGMGRKFILLSHLYNPVTIFIMKMVLGVISAINKKYKKYYYLINKISKNQVDEELLSYFLCSNNYPELIKKALRINNISKVFFEDVEEIKKINRKLPENIYM